MTQLEVSNRVKKIMAALFSIDENVIDERSSQDNVEKWDSLGQLALVQFLEEEFAIRLSDEQVLEMLNFKLVVHTVMESLQA